MGTRLTWTAGTVLSKSWFGCTRDGRWRATVWEGRGGQGACGEDFSSRNVGSGGRLRARERGSGWAGQAGWTVNRKLATWPAKPFIPTLNSTRSPQPASRPSSLQPRHALSDVSLPPTASRPALAVRLSSANSNLVANAILLASFAHPPDSETLDLLRYRSSQPLLQRATPTKRIALPVRVVGPASRPSSGDERGVELIANSTLSDPRRSPRYSSPTSVLSFHGSTSPVRRPPEDCHLGRANGDFEIRVGLCHSSRPRRTRSRTSQLW